jgi:signal transduction histidine kinase
VLDESAALVRPMADVKRLSLIIPAVEGATTFESDALRVRQILVNLLTNAVKFTDTGEITMAARCDGSYLRFMVRDTGIGIAPENLRRVFEPFWQVEQHASRRVGGTGLGLSVTRRLARLLGGDVSVDSIVGEGTTFYVKLPLVLQRAP